MKTASKKPARLRALRIETELSAGTWRAAPDPATVADGAAAYLAFLRAEDRSSKTLGKYATVFERVLHARGGEPEVRVCWRPVLALLPVW